MLVKSLFLWPSNRWRSRDFENKMPRSSDVYMVPKKVSGLKKYRIQLSHSEAFPVQSSPAAVILSSCHFDLFHTQTLKLRLDALTEALVFSFSLQSHACVRCSHEGQAELKKLTDTVCVLCVFLRYTLIPRYVCQLLQCNLNLPSSSQQKIKPLYPHISPIYLSGTKVPSASARKKKVEQ